MTTRVISTMAVDVHKADSPVFDGVLNGLNTETFYGLFGTSGICVNFIQVLRRGNLKEIIQLVV